MIGLALGGGAARGLSAIGAIEAMERFGVTASLIAGTSMGALIASLYAAGHDAASIEKIAKEARFLKGVGINFRWPWEGPFHLGPLEKQLTSLLPRSFEDLATPLFITACDIDNGELVILSEGSVVDAVVASCSVPGIFTPKTVNMRRLVDGGVREQLPVAPLLAAGAKHVYCISNGFLVRPRPHYRGVFRVLSRAIDIMGRANMERAVDDPRVQLIEPAVQGLPLHRLANIDRIIDAGRLSMEEVLSRTHGEQAGNSQNAVQDD